MHINGQVQWGVGWLQASKALFCCLPLSLTYQFYRMCQVDNSAPYSRTIPRTTMPLAIVIPYLPAPAMPRKGH
jgi:hypothetical protein